MYNVSQVLRFIFVLKTFTFNAHKYRSFYDTCSLSQCRFYSAANISFVAPPQKKKQNKAKKKKMYMLRVPKEKRKELQCIFL